MAWKKQPNKRKNPRISEFWSVAYEYNQSIKHGMIKNFSVSGCYIQLSHKFEIGQHIHAALLCHQLGPMEFIAQVKWQSAEGVGIEFIQPVSDQLKSILQGDLAC